MIAHNRCVVTAELESGELVTVIYSAKNTYDAVTKVQNWFPGSKLIQNRF